MAVERFVVEAGHITQFARAIGETDEVYLSGSLAPPTFTVASAHADPTNPLRPNPDRPWFGSGRDPVSAPPTAGGDGNSLYAEHRFEYHRHLRPGDVLAARSRPGRTWEKEGSRGGHLTFTEYVTEFVEEATGEPVVTSTVVSVAMSRRVGEAARAGDARPVERDA
jgi:hypothetical protein